MKVPQVSVVIPAYNEEGYIGRLLRGLESQDFKDFEVIVSDARSTDKTVEEINSFADRLRIKIAEAPPKNPGAGRNAGVRISVGEWLLFLDADDDIDDKDFISKLLSGADKKGWRTASARMEARGTLPDRLGTKFYYGYLKLVSHTKHPIAPGACIFTHRDVFEKNNGFNEKITFGEDNDYVTRAAKDGFGFIDETYYYVDLRRFEEERSHILRKSISNEIHRLTHGFKFDTSPHEYEFGKHHKKS